MAINIKELRIGNLVLAGNMNQVNFGKGPYKQTVREVALISLDIDDEYDEYIGHVELGKHNHEVDDLCRNIEPIPLTEEWLLKLGFEADTNIFAQGVYNSPILGHYIDYDSGIFTYRYYSTALRDVQSVHQLQNLCQALTGEELQIKEI